MFVRGSIALATLLILFAILPWPMEWLRRALLDEARRLEQDQPVPECQNRFATLVVLGGGLTPAGDSPPRMIRRLEVAQRLLRDQNVPRTVIVTGGFTRGGVARSEAQAGVEFLKNAGLLHARLLEENQSRNTYENALFTRTLMEREKLAPDIVLITDNAHLPRAVATFRKQGFRVCAVGTLTPGEERQLRSRFGAPNLHYLLWLGYELLGGWYYRLLGRA